MEKILHTSSGNVSSCRVSPSFNRSAAATDIQGLRVAETDTIATASGVATRRCVLRVRLLEVVHHAGR